MALAAAYGLSVAAVAGLVATSTDFFRLDIGDLEPLIGDDLRNLLGNELIVGGIIGDGSLGKSRDSLCKRLY